MPTLNFAAGLRPASTSTCVKPITRAATTPFRMPREDRLCRSLHRVLPASGARTSTNPDWRFWGNGGNASPFRDLLPVCRQRAEAFPWAKLTAAFSFRNRRLHCRPGPDAPPPRLTVGQRVRRLLAARSGRAIELLRPRKCRGCADFHAGAGNARPARASQHVAAAACWAAIMAFRNAASFALEILRHIALRMIRPRVRRDDDDHHRDEQPRAKCEVTEVVRSRKIHVYLWPRFSNPRVPRGSSCYRPMLSTCSAAHPPTRTKPPPPPPSDPNAHRVA